MQKKATEENVFQAHPTMDNFVKMFEDSVRSAWDKPAAGEFKISDETYRELAENIFKLQTLWTAAGLGKGDKVAINARSSVHWIEVFMAAVSGGFVSVQLFNGFLPGDVQKLTVHSDSKILYTEKRSFAAMDFEQMTGVLAVIDTESMEILAAREDFAELYARRDDLFKERFPKGLTPEDVSFEIPAMEDVCAIMYTSGSTGSPKGVMLTVKNFSYNVGIIPTVLPFVSGENYVSILPYAHIFGLTCDVIIPLTHEMHVVVLGRPPIPSNVEEIMREYQPRIFLAVPLILNKFVEYTVGNEMHSVEGAAKLAAYEDYPEFCSDLRERVLSALGGRIGAFATGGAAIPPDIENLLAFQINMPFFTGYGLTECAPVIAAGHIGSYKRKSCGEILENLQYKIDSIDEENVAGELLIKGDNVFAGYYKNPEATAAAFTEDGWFRTGDLGTVDKDKTLFLVGRCKSMLLSSNGQNVYPEEIEVVLNSLPYVAESIIVQRGNALHALIVPNMDRAATDHIDASTLNNVMAQNIKKLNTCIPTYSAVSSYELMHEPFAKTPKGSIRRFMYS